MKVPRIKIKTLLGMLLLAGSWGGAMAETFRCEKPDGTILFQESPCPLAEIVTPDAPRAASAAVPPAASRAAPTASAAPAPAVARRPVKPAEPARPLTVPGTTAAAPAGTDADEPLKPTRRKREVIELSAQFERCRADVPGFAEKSATVYAAWTQRHAQVLAEYRKVLAAKVRYARRGETTLPLHRCTDDWLAGVEPLSRMPDPRFQTVERTWQVFMGALMTGDRVTALDCLDGSAEARWKQRVEGLSDDELRRLGAAIRGLKVQWGDDYEKEGVVADTDNRVMGIAFRNVNEEWKITEMGGTPIPVPTF